MKRQLRFKERLLMLLKRLLLLERLLLLKRLLLLSLLVVMSGQREAFVAACWRHAASRFTLLRSPVAFLAHVQAKQSHLCGLLSIQSGLL